jgi:hypothetical protein
MAYKRKATPLIYQPTEAELKKARKLYRQGTLTYEELNRRILEDPRAWDGLLQCRVTDENVEAVTNFSAAEWNELKARLSPGDEWWYAAQTTPTWGFGVLVRLVNGNVVERTRILWKS